jgi:hypothetical protein
MDTLIATKSNPNLWLVRLLFQTTYVPELNPCRSVCLATWLKCRPHHTVIPDFLVKSNAFCYLVRLLPELRTKPFSDKNGRFGVGWVDHQRRRPKQRIFGPAATTTY